MPLLGPPVSDAVREGGCLCGRVRYRCTGPGFDAGYCHCRSCRRASGAPYVAWVTFRNEDFTLTGEAAVHRSSPAVVRRFCPACGTPLTYAHCDAPGQLDVTIASFDDPGSFEPAYHIWLDHALPWVALDDGLPRYAEGRR